MTDPVEQLRRPVGLWYALVFLIVVIAATSLASALAERRYGYAAIALLVGIGGPTAIMAIRRLGESIKHGSGRDGR